MGTWKVNSFSRSNRSYMTRSLVHLNKKYLIMLIHWPQGQRGKIQKQNDSVFRRPSPTRRASKANSVTFSSFAIYSYTPFNHFSRTNNPDTDNPSSLTTRARSLERERERDFSVELQRRNVHFALAQYDGHHHAVFTSLSFSDPSPTSFSSFPISWLIIPRHRAGAATRSQAVEGSARRRLLQRSDPVPVAILR